MSLPAARLGVVAGCLTCSTAPPLAVSLTKLVYERAVVAYVESSLLRFALRI